MTEKEIYLQKQLLLLEAKFKKLEDDLHKKHSLSMEKIAKLEKLIFELKVG